MISDAVKKLERKIAPKKLQAGVIGLSYVGLPLSFTFMRKGCSVLGFDLDPTKVEKIKAGQSYNKHIPAEELTAFIKQGLFDATADFSRLNAPDALLICAPTPLTKSGEPDLQYTIATGEAIAGQQEWLRW